MNHVYESNKSVDEVVEAVLEIIPNYKFGLQHIHNPTQKLQEKGIDFTTEVKIIDICNPQIAYKFFTQDISLSSLMPCKISVYDDNGQTKLAMNSLVATVERLNPDLVEVAQEAETTLLKIIEEAR